MERSDTIQALVDGFEYRIMVSDCVKCQEKGCFEPSLPCIWKYDDSTVHYFCPLHAVANGYCERCGEYDENLGRDNRTMCLSCIQECEDDDLGDEGDFNDYGLGNPDEPNQPSIQ